MNTWEYYVVTISEKDVEHDIDKAHVMESTSIEGRLNYWGGQGWELVALLPAIPGTNAQESIHRSAEENWRDVLLVLLGEVARSYADLRGFQLRLEIAEKNIRTQEDTVHLTQTRATAGLATQLDVSRAVAEL